ncbi:MAG TPA: hypothetical protein VIP05_04450 [Burkholderiaceae bacterium]
MVGKAGAAIGVAVGTGASLAAAGRASAAVGAAREPPSAGSARAAVGLAINVIATADIASSEAAANTRRRTDASQ